MKTTLAFLALISASVMARGEASQDQAFLQFVSQYNKDVRDSRTFIRKQRMFHINDDIINNHNAKKNVRGSVYDPDALILKHNWTSDLEPEEY